MKFSVLIAHYNNLHYFRSCYESLTRQTFQDFEIVIVDDFSTDDSYVQLKNIAQQDARIKLYQNESNKGVGFTKRKCIELASGEFCGFVDPDDALSENAIAISLEQYKKHRIVATHSQLNLCNSELQKIKLFSNTRKVKNGNRKFFNINFEVNHFFTFNKSIYNKTDGINSALTSAVDQDLYLKMYEMGDLVYINQPLYQYRLHEKGVSQEKSKKEKLNKNWDLVLRNTTKRRGFTQLFGKPISEISNLPNYIFQKENTLLRKILRKI